VRAEQTVSEMVAEVLARQAEELAARTGRPFREAHEEVRQTEAGRQLAELADGPHRHERARYWQAHLRFPKPRVRPSNQSGAMGARARRAPWPPEARRRPPPPQR
jgi:hypothetical protein